MAPGSTSTTPTTTCCARVQRGPPLRGDDGPLPGRSGGPPGRCAAGRPRNRVGARNVARGRRLGGGPTGLDRGERAPRRGACDPPGGHRRGATTRICAGSDTSCSRRRSRPPCSRSTTRSPGRPWRASTRTTTPERRTGPRPPAPGVPRRGMGRGSGPRRRTSRPRDEVEDHWPALPDHWAAYGASETVEFPERGDPPLTNAEVAYGRRQAELFGSATRWVSQQLGPWGKVVRGGDTPGRRGVIIEALTGWWLVAREEPG